MKYIALILITFTSTVAFGSEVPQVMANLLGPLTGLWLGISIIVLVTMVILGAACALGWLLAPMTRNKWDDQLVLDCSKWYLRLAEWLPSFGKTQRVILLEGIVGKLENMVAKQMDRADKLEAQVKKGKKR